MKTSRFGISAVVLVLLTVLAPARGEEPALTVEKNPSDPTGFAVVKFKLSKGDDVVWEVRPKPAAQKSYRDGEYAYLILNGPEGVTYEVTADWINWDAKKRGRPYENVLIGKAPQPPPVPPTPPGPTPPGPVPPGPQPPDPTPSGPLRVIFVYESAQLLTPQQQWVMFGEKVRTYLDANAKGWRRYDKDVDAANEKDADLRSVWQASKVHVTTVPCVVVASGTKIEILPLPATEDAAVALFAKYAPKGRAK